MTQLDPTRSHPRLDDLETIIPIEIEPVAAEPSEPTALVEAQESLAASRAESELTGALAELKRRSERMVDTVESVTRELTPTRIAIGVGVAVGVTLLAVAITRRARRPRRPPSTVSLIARSFVREAAGRMVLGAAATIGARLAEAAVPMLAAAILERASSQTPKRSRKSSKSSKSSRSRSTATSRASQARLRAGTTTPALSAVDPARDDDSKRFGGGTRDAVEEASWESFPASDPAAFYR